MRILPADTLIDYRADGAVLARSPHPLGPYPPKITERLEHWAVQAPGRTFLAQRDSAHGWRRLTYGAALASGPSHRTGPDRSTAVGLPSARDSVGQQHRARHCWRSAAMYAGVPYAPVAPSYSLLAREFTTLRALWTSLNPGMVFAADGALFDRALASVAGAGRSIVTSASTPTALRTTTVRRAARRRRPTSCRRRCARARRSGHDCEDCSTRRVRPGMPKGVINTQRMLCSNQEMIRDGAAAPRRRAAGPVRLAAVESHVRRQSQLRHRALQRRNAVHRRGEADAGGVRHDDSRTCAEIATTAYFNVPRGYDLLVPRLRADAGVRAVISSAGSKMLFCAAASLRQQIADELIRAGDRDARGARIPFVTGLGATESAPFALCAGDAAFTGGRIGVPAPGVELKLAPVGDQMEGRLRGPNITPGYWADDELTREAFDEEGYYRLGDALALLRSGRSVEGICVSGTHRRGLQALDRDVGEGRAASGEDARAVRRSGARRRRSRDTIATSSAALVFPNVATCRRARRRVPRARRARRQSSRTRAVRERVRGGLRRRSRREHPASSTAVVRAILLEEPPSIDAQETTEKGSVNQKAVLRDRAALVDATVRRAGPRHR